MVKDIIKFFKLSKYSKEFNISWIACILFLGLWLSMQYFITKGVKDDCSDLFVPTAILVMSVIQLLTPMRSLITSKLFCSSHYHKVLSTTVYYLIATLYGLFIEILQFIVFSVGISSKQGTYMLILVAVLFFETEIFITFSLKFFVPSILGFLGLYAFEMLSDDFMKAIASIDLSLISSMFVGMIIIIAGGIVSHITARILYRYSYIKSIDQTKKSGII